MVPILPPRGLKSVSNVTYLFEGFTNVKVYVSGRSIVF